jgi:hypothetical protein
MSSVMHCQHCRGAISITPQLAGQSMLCPHCQGPIVVPAMAPHVPMAMPVANAPPVANKPPVRMPAGPMPQAEFSQPAAAPTTTRKLPKRKASNPWAIIMPVMGVLAGGLSIIAMIVKQSANKPQGSRPPRSQGGPIGQRSMLGELSPELPASRSGELKRAFIDDMVTKGHSRADTERMVSPHHSECVKKSMTPSGKISVARYVGHMVRALEE